MSDVAPKSRDFDDLAREEGADAVRAAVEAARSISTLRPSNDNTGRPIPIEFFSEIEPSLNAIWTVKDLIPAGGTTGLYGAPGTGKSFMALDLALHVALGRDWFGRPTRQGGVIYLCAEGAEGARRRIAAFRTNYEVTEEVPFALVPSQLDFLEGGDIDRLIEAVTEQAARLACPIELVVIDTLSRTFGGGDENTSAMANYVTNVGRLQQALACGLIIVHHSPKDQANDSPRGHGSLLGALDTCIKVEGASDPRRVKVKKQKDAEEAPDFTFRLQPVLIGHDAEGVAVSSCIVVEAARFEGELGAMMSAGRAKRQPLSSGASVTLKALRDLAALGAVNDEPAPPGILERCGDATPVRLEEWRREALGRLQKPDTKPDSARRSFDRNSDALQDMGFVQIFEGWAWLPTS